MIKLKIIEDREKLHINVNPQNEIKIQISGSGGILPFYEGAYSVIPKVSEIVLNTKNKSMKDDVTIFQIPYKEVSNPAGGTTITIGLE